MSLRLVLAEDHAMVRESLCLLLTTEGYQVVGVASNGEEAVRLAAQFQPDVAVLDISMPLLNGIDAAREIRRIAPRTECVLLTMQDRGRYVWEAAQAGVAGYVLKSRSAANLIDAVREVASGRLYVSEGVSKEVFIERSGSVAPPDVLSARERQVLQLIAEGRSNKDVGAQLGISARTVECHRANIMAKLDIHEVSGLVRYAVRCGLIEP